MEALKKYWSLIAIGLLLIIIFLGGYFFGQSLVQIRDLKKDKQEYLKVNKEQDSIIKVSAKEIIRISHERDSLIAEGIQINENATYDYKTNISKERTNLKKKMDSIPNLSVQQLLDLFSKLSDNYKPIR